MIKIALRSILMLDYRGRIEVACYSLIRILISLLDLVGVAAVGLIISIAANGTSGVTPKNKLSNSILNFLHLNDNSISKNIAYLGFGTALIFLSRLFLTYKFTRKTLQVLAKYEVQLADTVRQKLFYSGIIELQVNDSIRAAQIFTTGVSSAIRITGMVVSSLADIAALLGLIVVMGVASPLSMLGSVIIFSLPTYFSVRHFGNRTEVASKEVLRSNLNATKKVQETYFAYRELITGGQLEMLTEQAMDYRKVSSKMLVDAQFCATAPRLLLEATMVVVVMFVGLIIWATNPSTEFLTIFGIFLTASSRFIPVVASLMANISAMRYASGEASLFLDFVDDEKKKNISAGLLNRQKNFIAKSDIGQVETVSLADVTFGYPGSNKTVLKSVTVSIYRGDFVGVIGRSGVGKSTLVDLIIGVLNPSEGRILINGVEAADFVNRNPGVIAYVPQTCGLLDGSILENILYRKSYEEHELNDAISALKAARLWDFVEDLPLGINTVIGERGSLLSGGQRQRLSIARGLFQNASLIVLDESTNALDSFTEEQIYEILNDIKGRVTVIVIGHNPEKVKLNANRLLLVEDGTVTELPLT